MSTPRNPQREHPSTYAVQDRSNEEEMKRLRLQDRMTNLSLGGLLPEQENPERFHSILDVGCGTGGWLIALAKTYPGITRLVGVDISGRMLDFARAEAEAEAVADRVEFLLMDALRMLEFPNAFFDMVNQRAGMSWLRTWDWPKLLQEYRRVTRPDGVIRITEPDFVSNSTSRALVELNELAVKAFFQSGHFFSQAHNGVTSELANLLNRHNIQDVQTRAYTLEYHSGTELGQLFATDMRHLFRTIKPFLQKWTRLPDDYDVIHQRMVEEMNAPDFAVSMGLLTAWGVKR